MKDAVIVRFVLPFINVLLMSLSYQCKNKNQDFRFSNIKTKTKRTKVKPPFLFSTILEAKTQSLQTMSWIKGMVCGP